MKKIVVLNGNPKRESFCHALAESYAAGAMSAGHQVDVVHISELEFDPILRSGYESKQPVEESLQRLKHMIKEAAHFVVVFPVWWGSVPASLKGVLDRIFLPGFAFKYEKNDIFPARLLEGRSARMIMTMDTPLWYYRLVYGSPATKMMKRTVLEFCGFNPVKVSKFGSVLKSTEACRNRFIEKVYAQGNKAD